MQCSHWSEARCNAVGAAYLHYCMEAREMPARLAMEGRAGKLERGRKLSALDAALRDALPQHPSFDSLDFEHQLVCKYKLQQRSRISLDDPDASHAHTPQQLNAAAADVAEHIQLIADDAERTRKRDLLNKAMVNAGLPAYSALRKDDLAYIRELVAKTRITLDDADPVHRHTDKQINDVVTAMKHFFAGKPAGKKTANVRCWPECSEKVKEGWCKEFKCSVHCEGRSRCTHHGAV